MEKVNEKIEYYGGYIEICNNCFILNEKVLALFSIKYRPKKIPFSQIKEISSNKKGFIHINLASISIDTGALNTTINRLPNEITFKTDEEMERAYNKMMKAFQEYLNNKDNTQIIQNSSADEIKKFKELLDSGIITQEEFDAKKKQLLGL